MSTRAEAAVRRHDRSALMRQDSLLPAGIAPACSRSVAPAGILLTGATGFLGRYLLQALLARDAGPVFCVVRGADTEVARARLLAALNQAGAGLAELPAAIHVLVGDTAAPRLGLADDDHDRVVRQVGAIYHCAAEVNWARSYRQLRRANVLPTLEVIRLACEGPAKRVYFVSTIGVCFASSAPGRIDESTDMMPFAADMPLGYAQSKCVAEALLREAAARGLPVSIVRPGLIAGDSETGVSNDRDILCALLERCVTSGTAFDIDWLMDCVPVDFVARVLAELGGSTRPQWEVLHLIHDQGRHWREMVLWMNLYGYPISLEPEGDWIAANFDRDGVRDRLFGYRRFFRGPPGGSGVEAPYRAYLAPAQERVDSAITRRLLDGLGLAIPPLDSALLHNYFTHYAAAGMVPRTGRRVAAPGADDHANPLEQALRSRLDACDLDLIRLEERPFRSSNSILNEISTIRLGSRVGMRGYDAVVRQRRDGLTRRLPILLKAKAGDALIEDLMTEVAQLYDEELGRHCERFKKSLGFAQCHERELALYELEDPRLRRLTPACHATQRDSRNGVWSLALEYLGDADRVDMQLDGDGWPAADIGAAIAGMSQLHAIWFGRVAELRSFPWLPPEMTSERVVSMQPFWTRLAVCADRHFSGWLGASLSSLQHELIDTLEDWWPALLELPRTLIHNDFSPRNVALRRTGGAPILCAFDWELAALGLPQHDLAEFLCFVADEGMSAREVDGHVEDHRRSLERAAGTSIDPDAWRRGFVLSLQHLLINRLPMYTVIHRFKPQPYLPRVVRNWRRLYQMQLPGTCAPKVKQCASHSGTLQ